jgi:hypothetical protein
MIEYAIPIYFSSELYEPLSENQNSSNIPISNFDRF